MSAGSLREKPYRLEVNINDLEKRSGKEPDVAALFTVIANGKGRTSPNGEDGYILHPNHSRGNLRSVISVGYQHS